jgi:hypothetical protein
MIRKYCLVIFVFLVLLSCRFFPVSGDETGQNPETDTNHDRSAYFLPDPSIGLNELDSYSMAINVSFTGNHDGQSLEYNQSFHQQLNREGKSQFTYSNPINGSGEIETIISGNIGDANYWKQGNEACKVTWGELAEGYTPYNPVELLPALLAVEEAGFEEINGIQTRHYTFDAKALGYPTTSIVEGDVWLAQDGGYVMKLMMLIQDSSGYFGEGIDGEQEIRYELTDVNGNLSPQLPEGCLPVLMDFPALEDAVDIERLPGTLTYTSPASISTIQEYYDQTLPGLGWTSTAVQQLSDVATLLVFRNPDMDQIAYITLQSAQPDIWVTVQVDEEDTTLLDLLDSIPD